MSAKMLLIENNRKSNSSWLKQWTLLSTSLKSLEVRGFRQGLVRDPHDFGLVGLLG